LGEAYWAMRDEPDGAELVFAFAGHGGVSPGGEGYVLLADGPFTRSELTKQVVVASPVRMNHVIVDACAAYYLVSRGGDAVVPVANLAHALERAPGDDDAWARTGVLVATSDAADVHESSALGGGVFSYVLRSALAGGADANHDGKIEYGEVAAFIAAANTSVDDPRARLQIHARAPAQAPHAALLDLARGNGRFLVLDQKGGARVRVVDAHGLPFIEVHSDVNAADVHVTLALANDPFYVVERGQEEAVLVPRGVGAYAMSSLRFTPATQTRSVDPQRTQLFATPYGPAFVHGFLAHEDLVGPADDVTTWRAPWADVGAPSTPPPWGTLAWVSLGTSGALAVATGASLAGNSLSLVSLDQHFHQTGTLDPTLSLQADTWLTSAAVFGALALGTAVAAGGFALLDLNAEKP
jgi:hypothetical protein